MADGLLGGLLGSIYSQSNVAKRKLSDLLGNPLESAQQFVGNLNDRARILNQMTATAAREGVDYGPESQRLAGLLAEAYNPIGMVVYHGSPAKFSRFDPTKIGSGEGHQAYGYGHYLAENPDVAKSYIAPTSNSANANYLYKGKLIDPNDEVKRSAAFNIMANNGDKTAIFSQYKPTYWETKSGKQFKKEIERMNYKDLSPAGSFYEVDLPDEQIARMVNWDKPIKEQSKEIQDIAKSLGLEMDDLGGDIIARIDAKRPEGAEKLRQAGIPGIRYFDAQSRGGQPATTENFVVFPGNEDLLTILKRNGGLLD